MFGYVRIQKSELLVREAEEYKAFYCSLCKVMGKEYGFFTRFILSYDSTFYALLSSALKDSVREYKVSRCRINPLKKCTYTKTNEEELKKAAAFSILSGYYQAIDGINDSKFFKRLLYRILKLFFMRKRKKAIKNGFKYMDDLLKSMTEKQQMYEKDPKGCLDMYCEPTAEMLGDLLCFEGKTEGERRVLKNLGYYLGRWIYLMDAVDDYEKDIKKSAFNPFVNSRKSILQIKEYSKGLLNLCQYEIICAFNLLDLKKYSRIIENILTLGLKSMENKVLSEIDKEEKEKRKE